MHDSPNIQNLVLLLFASRYSVIHFCTIVINTSHILSMNSGTCTFAYNMKLLPEPAKKVSEELWLSQYKLKPVSGKLNCSYTATHNGTYYQFHLA